MTKKSRIEKTVKQMQQMATAVTTGSPDSAVLFHIGSQSVFAEDIGAATPERWEQLLDVANAEFLRAVFTGNLALFQGTYRLLRDSLGVCPELVEWLLPNESGGKESFTTGRLCLKFATPEICEQNFRFSLFNEGSLFRSEPGGPLRHIDGIARCLNTATHAGAQGEIEFFGSLAERFIATVFGVVFRQFPHLLDPSELLSFMQRHFTAYHVVAPIINRYQQHYEREWRAGDAPSDPVLDDEILDPASTSQVLIVR